VGPLSDKEVIARVSRNYVPVAVNLYVTRNAKGASGDFYRKLAEQRPKQYQGLYVVTAECKVLAARSEQPTKGTWTDDTLRLLDQGLDAFGEVTPRRPSPTKPNADHGLGLRDDGGIALATYVRPLSLGLDPRGRGPVVIDRVALTKDELKGLTPAGGGAKGETWRVPEETAKALHKVTSPLSDSNWLAKRDEVTKAALTGKIDRVSKGVAYVPFRGSIQSAHVFQIEPHKGKKVRAEVSLRGAGTMEAKTGKLLTLVLIGDGKFRNYPPYDQESAYAAVVEWRREEE
jgi:hypothetical protein